MRPAIPLVLAFLGAVVVAAPRGSRVPADPPPAPAERTSSLPVGWEWQDPAVAVAGVVLLPTGRPAAMASAIVPAPDPRGAGPGDEDHSRVEAVR